MGEYSKVAGTILSVYQLMDKPCNIIPLVRSSSAVTVPS